MMEINGILNALERQKFCRAGGSQPGMDSPAACS